MVRGNVKEAFGGLESRQSPFVEMTCIVRRDDVEHGYSSILETGLEVPEINGFEDQHEDDVDADDDAGPLQ
jgi:hypothetical protein